MKITNTNINQKLLAVAAVLGLGAAGINTATADELNNTSIRDGVEVRAVLADEVLSSRSQFSGFAWEQREPVKSLARTAATETKSGFRWADRSSSGQSAMSERGSIASVQGFKWGVRSAADQQGFKWGVRSTADQQGFKWGVRSTADQQGFKWGVRSTADQQGFKWGVRSTADQQGFKWGVRSTADQQGFKWGVRSTTDQKGFKWGVR